MQEAPQGRPARSGLEDGAGGVSTEPHRDSGPGWAGVDLAGGMERLAPHDHVCVVCESPQEWRTTLISFVSTALRRGETCISIVDAHTADEIRRALANDGVDIADAERCARFSVLEAGPTVTRQPLFSPKGMAALLPERIRTAFEGGTSVLHIAADMAGDLQDHPGADCLLACEAGLNRGVIAEYSCITLCGYDRSRLAPEVIRDALKTHPLVFLRGRICRNPYYVPSADSPDAGLAAREVARWLDNIERQCRIDDTLREDDGRHRLFLDSTGDIAFVKDADFRYLLVNEAAVRSFGKLREEILGSTDDALLNPQAAARCRETDIQALQTGRLVISEEPVADRIYETRKFRVPLRNGCAGIGGFIRDVTDRKKAEEALRESRAILEAMLNASPARVFWKDKNLRYSGCNEPFAHSAGFASARDVIGKDDFAMAWRDQAEDYRSDDRRVMESGQSKPLYEEPQTAPSGEIRHRLISKVPLRGADGNIVGVMGAYFDVTDLKRSEQALQEAQSLLNEVGSIAKIGGWRMDLITRTAAWTRGTYEIVEIELGAPIPGPDEHVQYYLPEDRALVTEAMRALIEDDVPLDFEARLRTAKGRIKWCRAMGRAVRKDGKAVEVVGTFQDVTEWKRAEQELRFRNAILTTQQESSIDGILVVDENAKIVTCNRRFVEMLNIPREYIEKTLDEPVLQHVTRQMADPETFLRRVRYLYEHRDETARDELRLADGRVLDRYSAPMIGSDGCYYGRVWYFRDVTAAHEADLMMKRQLGELRQWYSVTLDREERNLELKREVDKLLARLGEPKRYGV